MRFLRLTAVLAAVVAGSLGIAGEVAATPLSSGAVATLPAQTASDALVEKAQFYGRRYYGPGYSGRRYYRPGSFRRGYYRRPVYYRPYYRPRFYAPVFGPRVVCRIRYGRYGGRQRVCVRRF